METHFPTIVILFVLFFFTGLDNMRLRKRLHDMGVDPEAKSAGSGTAPLAIGPAHNKAFFGARKWITQTEAAAMFDQKPCDPKPADLPRFDAAAIEDDLAALGIRRVMTNPNPGLSPSPVLTNLAAAFAAKVEPTERLVLLAMVAGADDNGISRQVTRFLASLTGLHTSTVAAAFRSLSKAGLIRDTGERHGSRNQHRIWQVFPPQEQTSE